VFQPDGGSVGIGTSPSEVLHVVDSNPTLTVSSSSVDQAVRLELYEQKNGSADLGGFFEYSGASANALLIGTTLNSTDTTHLYLPRDGSGNVLVGKTATTQSTAGTVLYNNGQIYATANNAQVQVLTRTSTDGKIQIFYKDSAEVGSISSRGGEFISVGSGDTNLEFNFGSDQINPSSGTAARDNAIDLGNSNARFTDIFATNGTIQTSDRNEKQDIEALSDAEQRVAVAAKGLLRKFRWKSAVEEKGDDARIHFGIIAQDLQDAFAAEGLDAGRYAMFISSTWTDEETGEERTRMGVRYSELLAFIISAI